MSQPNAAAASTLASPTPPEPEHRVITAARPPLNPRTGEPWRPVWSWIASGALLVGALLSLAGLLLAMWQSIFEFPTAAWLNGRFDTQLGDKLRILLVVILFVVGLGTAALASIGAWYSFLGYRWTRIWAAVAAAVSLATLLINPLAAASIAFVAGGAALLWLPPLRRWFAEWTRLRQPAAVSPATFDDVHYGPLPRYR